MLKNDVTLLTRALFRCIFALTKNKIFKLKKQTMKSKVQLKILFIILAFWSGLLNAQQLIDNTPYRKEHDRQIESLLRRQYQEAKPWFDKAYAEYPTIPRGVLEAVAFQYTRFDPNVRMDTVEMDPSEIPRTYSIMGLTLHGKGVFRENARLLAAQSPYPLDAILWDPGTAVKAYACVFARKQQEYGCFDDSLEQYWQIFVDLCELPVPNGKEDDFAMNSFLYMIYWFLSQPENVAYGGPGRKVDFEKLFGDEYGRLRGDKAEVGFGGGSRSINTTPDYPNAVFNAAASCNYTIGRGGTTISAVTVHYTQGTYAGAIAWFQNCSAKASAHYVIRSIDGQVTQMVLEADKAWHVGVANSYTIGIEHEAYGDIASYFTMNMYQSSANLVKNICSRRSNINPHRVFYRDTLDDGTVLNYGVHSLGGATACTQIRGHQHYPSQTHTDPGPYWNWNLYYKLINDNPTVTILTSQTGVLTDSGGLTGNYGDDERKLYRIHVAGADSIALEFQQFDLEQDYDFLWIYNGASEFSPLIGRWNTQSPGRVVATGEDILVEFRSDCATNAAGWKAQWSACQHSPGGGGDDGGGTGGDGDDLDEEEEDDSEEEPPIVDNTNPQTQINLDQTQWITGDFYASFTDSDDSGIKWAFYQIMESDGVGWYAHGDQGFVCDNFDHSLNPDVWVNNNSTPWVVHDGALCQNNASADYVGVAAHHNGSSHTAYLYDFYLKFNSGEKCSFFFNCNNAPSLTSLFSGYEVCFDMAMHTVSVYRLILGAKRLLKKNDQVYFMDETSYFCRVIYDHSTGEIIVMRHANKLLRTVDTVLATTPNSYIGFVTRHASVSVDNLRVYGSRSSSVHISVGNADTCNIQTQAANGLGRAKLKSVVVDRAYKFSTLLERMLRVDYTAPPAVADVTLRLEYESLFDGTQQVHVSASWPPSSDEQSGVCHYYYHNSPCNHCHWNPNWTDNLTLLSCHDCYTFTTNQMVSFSVIVENIAGLRSPATTKIVKTNLPEKPLNKKPNLQWALSSRKSLSVTYQPTDSESSSVSMGSPIHFDVFDMTGRKLKSGEFKDYTTVDLTHLCGGIYLFRFMRGNTLLSTEKIVLPN